MWFGPSDHSLLVQIFLWEKDTDAAWREAQTGGCSGALWMELAAKQEQEHPADVLPIYERELERLLDRKNNDAYAHAVGLLRRSRALMLRLEDAGGFAKYVQKLRAVHKPKRNFIKLLDQAKCDRRQGRVTEAAGLDAEAEIEAAAWWRRDGRNGTPMSTVRQA